MSEVAEVKRVIRHILGNSGLPDWRELMDQADRIVASSGPVTWQTLTVRGGKPVQRRGLVPVDAIVYDDDQPTGEFLIWVDNGTLDTLEFAWYTDEPPTSFPASASIKVGPR